MRPDLGFYIQTINNIVKVTEEVGDKMNPSYEKLRGAIDSNAVSELGSESLEQIKEQFTKGTAQYEALLAQVAKLRPPAKVMGIHKKFERSYLDYVAGCKEMVDSIDPAAGKVDSKAFNLAEEKQDTSSDEISFSIQRMTRLLLK